MVKPMFAPTDQIWLYQLQILDGLHKTGIAPNIKEEEIKYVNRGQAKFVYSIPKRHIDKTMASNEEELLATATPLATSYPLAEEFGLLKEMHAQFGNVYTPAPEFYLETKDSKIMGMEFIKGQVIGDFVEKHYSNKNILKKLANLEGKIVGDIFKKTGKFHVEPHDENIIVEYDKILSPKFIDVLHFEKGTKEELLETYLSNYIGIREEIAQFKDYFLDGFYSTTK